jgi:hypothetical protein
MVRPRTGNVARIFGMFVIRKHSRNVATTAHRFNETFIRSQHLTCQVSRPSTYRTASNAGECQKRNDQEDSRIAARRIYAGSLSSVDPWLSGDLSREPAGCCRPPGREQPLPNHRRVGIAIALRLSGACAGSSGRAAGPRRPPLLQPSVSRQPLANPYRSRTLTMTNSTYRRRQESGDSGAGVIQMTEGIAGSLKVVWKFGKAEVLQIGGILGAGEVPEGIFLRNVVDAGTVYRGSEIRLIPDAGEFVRVQLIANNWPLSGVELREFGNSTIMRTQPPLAEGCVSG